MQTQELQTLDARLAQARLIRPASIIAKEQRSAQDLRQVKQGAVLRFGNKTYRVTATATLTECDKRYKELKKYTVTEFVLFCFETGETRYLEWEYDDELEVSFTERKLSAREVSKTLTYDDGEPANLDNLKTLIVEEEWELVFKGKTYDYDDDWYGKYRSSDGREANVFIAEFGDDSVGWLTVECWVDEDGENPEYEVFLSSDISPRSIEIVSLGE